MTRSIKQLEHNARIGIMNRGEAALRFIRAVREYNAIFDTSLTTMAFFSDVEEQAPFVKLSDEAIPLTAVEGYPGTGRSPYLDHELMLAALRQTGCSAVWPGWGFLSEDANFVEKLEKNGLVFLGPSAAAMALLGDKIAAKELAEKANVPILPWSRGALASEEAAKEMAERLGYPVIVKAANAGGGRGIRFVRRPEELSAQFQSARDETVRITGNDIVFMEILVERGRHLEVQVLADSHGNVNTFGVRDCSVQRKNQKIIEETPPPHLSAEFTADIAASAARLVRAAGYTGAGTVEYLYDLDREQYYFMEVNTRLQVEHPITETLYGIDLVQGQIAVARGEEVDLSAATPSGHVMEVRLNAEDPDREFSPAPGDVAYLKTPAGPGIRVDSGIEQGSTIPQDFDSMVAKIISHAPTRDAAIARLSRAISELRIRIENGTTNKAFLLELLSHPEIKNGGVDTGFVGRLLQQRERQAGPKTVRAALIAGAIELSFRQYNQETLNFRQQLGRSGRPRNLPKGTGYEVNLSALGHSYSFGVRSLGDDLFHISLGDSVIPCTYIVREEERVLILDENRHNVLVVTRGDILQCEIDGVPVPLVSDSGGYVRSPSPAVLLSVSVKPGERVARGDVLLVLEAMKMEMVVQAPGDGVVKELLAAAGAQVAAGQALVQIEEEKAERTDEGATGTAISLLEEELAIPQQWKMLERELLALFYGYDAPADVRPIFGHMDRFVTEHPDFEPRLLEVLLHCLEVYVEVERLFTQTEIESSLYSRPASYQELVSHYFLRDSDREKGLPQEFLTHLERALARYPQIALSPEDDWQTRALYHMYRSHGRLEGKNRVLREILVRLERKSQPRKEQSRLASVLDETLAIVGSSDPSVADAALHVRHEVVDRDRLRALKERQLKAIQKGIDELVGYAENADEPGDHLQEVVDAGPWIVGDLVRRALGENLTARRVAVELVGRRMVRDRDLIDIRYRDRGSYGVCHLLSKSKSDWFHTVVAVLPPTTMSNLTDLSPLLEDIPHDAMPEVMLVTRGATDEVDLENALPPTRLKANPDLAFLGIGVYPASGAASSAPAFRTFAADATWTEITIRRGLSPIAYRELRVYRLANFDLKILYRSESVMLIEATSATNARDTRLFAFCRVSEHEPEISGRRGITRMMMLEAVYMEAVQALRAAQARYRYRLQWNRIIIHNRSLLAIRLMQLRDYGLHLVSLTRDLGIERLVVYSRRKRWREDVVREIELLYLNVSQDQFTLRSRTPSDEPLATMDRYTARVVRARQRNTIYPYEFIKMITYAGFPLYSDIPRGEFEEYDIEVGDDGSQNVVSVKTRTPGENQSNVVFGTITNFDPAYPVPMKRVIILADPTGDLGSLAEGESRRVIAALDLASREDLPVEWVPISSGARITMDSGTENLDWTAAALRRIVEFTQEGGEINIIVPGINVGAQSYWDAEATMLMHTRGLLIMTENASLLLTGKKALEFSGSVSAETNIDIGGVEKIMGPNGQAQLRAANLSAAYAILFRHYRYTYRASGTRFPPRIATSDSEERDVTAHPYNDRLEQGFSTIGDIFSKEMNPERKKPFDMRQVMQAVIDSDGGYFERWRIMQNADTAIVWETRVGGQAVGMIGIESRPVPRIGAIPIDGPESWSGGTLFPLSSKKVARGINAFSGRVPLVILANLSGFDGSPESLRKLQLEYGAEIGRAVVNFDGPICFVVMARYHGGAYVVFSKSLNPGLRAAALEGSFASVIGGAPAAAVVFPKAVRTETLNDPRIAEMQEKLSGGTCTQKEFDDLYQRVYNEKQTALGQKFDAIHSVERARSVGSIDEIITARELRPYIIRTITDGIQKHGRE